MLSFGKPGRLNIFLGYTIDRCNRRLTRCLQPTKIFIRELPIVNRKRIIEDLLNNNENGQIGN